MTTKHTFPGIEKKEVKAAEKPTENEKAMAKMVKDGISADFMLNNDLGEEFDFNGFSPEITAAEMAAAMKGTDEKDRALYLNAAVQFIAIRGTQATQKVSRSMKVTGQQVLQATVNAFKISPTPTDRKTITFARIGNVMSQTVIRYLCQQNKEGTRFLGKIVADDFRPLGFPRQLCVPNAPGMFPEDKARRKCLMNGWKIWSWKFSRTIKPTQTALRGGAGGVVLPDDSTFTGQRVPEIDAQNKTFVDAMLASKFFTEAQKKATLGEVCQAWVSAPFLSEFEKIALVLYVPGAANGIVTAMGNEMKGATTAGDAATLVTAIGVERGRLLVPESLTQIITDALAAGGQDNANFYRCIRSLNQAAMTVA